MFWPKNLLKSRFLTQKDLKWPYFTPKYNIFLTHYSCSFYFSRIFEHPDLRCLTLLSAHAFDQSKNCLDSMGNLVWCRGYRSSSGTRSSTRTDNHCFPRWLLLLSRPRTHLNQWNHRTYRPQRPCFRWKCWMWSLIVVRCALRGS